MHSSAEYQDEEVTRVDPRQPPAQPSTGKLTLEPGQRVEHYELIRELGRGGMGIVYLARDMHLGRRVAIKFLTPRHREQGRRFLLEARATAQCHHENIVVIHAVNIREDVPYMVLEYLEGSSLEQYLEDRALPPSKAVELITPVVRALVHAHASGIIHRDLKPGNVFVTRSGAVKVLDFGIAKALAGPPEEQTPRERDRFGSHSADSTHTELGSEVGTARYMAPEQWGLDTVDGRTDLWAIGIILYRMLAGASPLADRSIEEIRAWAREPDDPVQNIAEVVEGLPPALLSIIERCLQKRKSDRFGSAEELLEALEALLPGRRRLALDDDDCPYPGLAAFQSSDADRFFGRTAEIRRAIVSIRDHPLLAIVGPSGLGKSSFVRAGLMPALRDSGEPWEMFTLRPGRHPLVGLANLCAELTTGQTLQQQEQQEQQGPELLVERLRSEPGFFGASLRERARRRRCRILILVDQFEELYTLVPDPEDRAVFARCILASADDASSPLRVVISLRSDFLDRVAEHDGLAQEVTRGLMLLAPMDRKAIGAALTQPAELAGYSFEDEAMVDEMLDALASTAGSLSLLQFAAARLWQVRDRNKKLLTRDSYEAFGGIAGTLAAHADATLASMAPSARKLSRKIFQRLVTPERTRAIVDLADLSELTSDSREVTRVIDQLVQSRLLVTDVRGGASETVVELVHESLITSWPTLRRWLDESEEDEVFVAQLREVARQWESRGRPTGLLWRGEALDDARRFVARHRGELPPREQSYLDAALWHANRSIRIRRALVVGAFGLLSCLVVGAAIALVQIRDAERVARSAEHAARASEQEARTQAATAQQETQRARAAESRVIEQLEQLEAEQMARQAAESKATNAAEDLRLSNAQLAQSNAELQQAVERAEQAVERAEQAAAQAAQATAAERKLSQELEKLLDKERERVRELEQKRGKIIDDLH